MKIGSFDLAGDCKSIETVLDVAGSGHNLAVDAMNTYTPSRAIKAAKVLEPYGLRWFEDICDPLDFEAHRAVIARSTTSFSRRGHLHVLAFDPARCYGIPEYVRIIECFEKAGWSSRDFQPHGGHLYSLHIAAALGLGGCECNPHNFQPFGGFADATIIIGGRAGVPDAPGVGFETPPFADRSLSHTALTLAVPLASNLSCGSLGRSV
jgi:D(-)-tartrate dehydratase